MPDEGRRDWKAIGEKAQASMDRMKASAAQQRADVANMTRYFIETLEAGTVGAGMGYWHGRNGFVPKKLGVPVDLWGTLIFKGLAFSGYAGDLTRDAHTVGNSFLTYFAGGWGAQRGQTALRAAKDKDGKNVALNRPLTEQEAKDRQADVRTIVARDKEPERTQISEGTPRAAAERREEVISRPPPSRTIVSQGRAAPAWY